ncbi:methyltransferase [Streptomyces lavendulocolor]|uniref:methyltransferase n=1 Tax=Streptomyces lavendulocolor TaxID=67316 RepID=UPI003C30DC09
MAATESDRTELAAELTVHMTGFLYSASLYTAAEAKIADHLADGPRTPAELGELSGLHGPYVRRLLRYLATREVFREDEDGRFHLTPMADLLRTGVPNSVRDSFLMLGNELFWKPIGKLNETVRKGSTIFDELYGAPFFEWLGSHPEEATIFNAGTAAFSGQFTDLVADTYPFPEGSRVVDVGGGRGGLLLSVLSKHPTVTGVLYDQESVLRENLLDEPQVAGRWKTEPGNFFESVPGGGDIYILKSILHDWSDENGLRILKATREGMPKGAKLLVVDAVIPQGNDAHVSKTIDMMMMTVFNGKERTLPEFQEILGAAGFTVTKVLDTADPVVSVIEAIAD